MTDPLAPWEVAKDELIAGGYSKTVGDGESVGIIGRWCCDVVPERVRWLWPGWLPLGKVVIVDGDPGLGKSTLLTDLAARLSTASPMPGGGIAVVPSNTLLLTAEDGVADTVVARLHAADADLSRVFAVEGVVGAADGDAPWPVAIPADLARLEAMIVKTGALLVIIDPFVAYLGHEVDSFRDQDVRRAMAAMSAVADRTGATIVLVRHLTKANGVSPIYRGGGSIGIIGAARVGLIVCASPNDENLRVLGVSKSNLAAMPGPLGYRLVPDLAWDCARVSWEGPVEIDLAGALSNHKLNAKEDEAASALAQAREFLLSVLADGPVASRVVEREAGDACVAWATARRAKDSLGVVSEKKGPYWMWRLP